MRREEVLQAVEANDIQLIRFIWTDNAGMIRAYVSVRDHLAQDLVSGLAIPKGMQCFSNDDRLTPDAAFGPVGEVRIVPDPETFQILPYVKANARMICEMREEPGLEPWAACPRSTLRRVASSLPYTVRASFENEFYLLVRENGQLVPYDRSRCFATSAIDSVNDLLLEMIHALEQQGVRVERCYCEGGPAQQEIIVRYDEVLRATDSQVTFRDTVRGVAQIHGIIASFMPKPFADTFGSGAHIHLSLWEGERNAIYAEDDPLNLSPLGYQFIGGVLKHAPAMVAITAPTVTSYKRLLPSTWSAAYTAYGRDNRDAVVRVASPFRGREAASVHIEVRCVDGTCNPYLAMAAVLAAGKDGIDNEIDPGEPVAVDPVKLPPEERKRRGIHRLPETLGEALKELERSEFYEKVFGSLLYQEYLKVKRMEWLDFNSVVTEWERERYAEIF